MSVREVAVRAYREALPVLGVSALGGLFAGTVLGGMEVEIRVVPGLLVLVPALLATRGNVYGSLGARLGSALHQGLIEPVVTLADDRLRAAIAAALLNGVIISGVAAVFAYAILRWLARPVAPIVDLTAIALLAGVFSGVVLAGVVVVVVMVGYRRGVDPDTLAGPVVTTTGDVVGMVALLAAVRIVLLGGG